MWQLENAKKAKFFVRQAKQTGHKIPEKFRNPPYLNPALDFFWTAFWRLNNNRFNGFGTGGIPITAVFEYSRHYGLDDDLEHDLIHYVQVLDAVYVEHADKKNNADTKPKRVRKTHGANR